MSSACAHLYEVVGEEAPLAVEVPLHPAILLYVPHVLDDVAQSQGEFVIMERLVLKLHHNLCSRQGEGGKGQEREKGRREGYHRGRGRAEGRERDEMEKKQGVQGGKGYRRDIGVRVMRGSGLVGRERVTK